MAMEIHPAVLLLRPPFHGLLNSLESSGFRPLKPWESDVSREQFLSSYCQSVRALVISGLVPGDTTLIRQLPQLGFVFSTSAGMDHIDVKACRERGIMIANAAGIFTTDAADFAVGMMLDLMRRISACNRYVKKGLWAINGDFELATKVGGKRVGIVGLGNIGSAVAKRLLAFDCTVSYTSRSKKHHVCFPFYSNTMELAAANDVLILTCALTNETKHIVNKHVLSALGKNGIIINVGRGALIDEKELVRSLVEAEIGGAGLDVFEDEPHVPKELFDMDNVVLSPHSAVLTHESLQDVCDITVGNLQAFFANKPLLSEVK